MSQELDQLIDSYLSGQLDAVRLARLQQLLRDPAAARRFLLLTADERQLRQLLAEAEPHAAPEPSAAAPARRRRSRRSPAPRRRSAAITWLPWAAAAVLLLALLPLLLEDEAGQTAPDPDGPPPLATTDEPSAADEELQLADGAIRITSSPDSVLRATGPTTVQLQEGRCTASIDPAAGVPFTLQTPEATIQVQGTVFTVERHRAVTRVAVGAGSVLLRDGVGTEQRLAAGDSWSSDAPLLHYPISAGDGRILNEQGSAPGALSMAGAAALDWQNGSVLVSSHDDIHSLRLGPSDPGLLQRLNAAEAMSIHMRFQPLDELGPFQLLFELIGRSPADAGGELLPLQLRSRIPLAPTESPIDLLTVFDAQGWRAYLDGEAIAEGGTERRPWRHWENVEAKLLTPSGSHTVDQEVRILVHTISVWDHARDPMTAGDPGPDAPGGIEDF